MADRYCKPYVESSAFIAWVKGEVVTKKRIVCRTEDVGGSKVERQEEVVELVERGKIVEHIFALAEQGQFSITTSSFTMAEVHKPKHREGLLDTDDNRLLDYFEHDHIKLVDVDRRIGEEANHLCRQFGLDPADAIHLACALRAGCDVLLTYDDKLLKTPHDAIRTEEPRILGQLVLPDTGAPAPLVPVLEDSPTALSPGEPPPESMQSVADIPTAAAQPQSGNEEPNPGTAPAAAESP